MSSGAVQTMQNGARRAATSTRYRDLDAWIAALEPVQFRFRGQVYELPSDIALIDIATLLRAEDTADLETLKATLGDEIYEQIVVEGKLGARASGELLRWVLVEYGYLAGESVHDDPDAESEEAVPAGPPD